VAIALWATGIVNGAEGLEALEARVDALEALPQFDPLAQPLVSIETLGCVAGDLNVDNGPLLTAALARFGPELKGIVFVPAKQFWFKTTADSGKGVGITIIGAGRSDQARGDGAWRNQAVSLFSWNGPDGGTLYRIRRSAHAIAGLSFSGSRQPDNVFEPSNTTLIEITQANATWPVGEITIDASLTNAGRGIYTAPGNHGDHVHARLMSHVVKVPYETNENQSVDHWIDILVKGDCDRILNFRDGGRLRHASVVMNGRVGTVLSLGDPNQQTGPTENQGYYNVEVMADGGDRIGTVIAEQWYAPTRTACVATAKVFAASTAVIDTNYRKLNDKSKIAVEVIRVGQQ
jgi:hypothetical protein